MLQDYLPVRFNPTSMRALMPFVLALSLSGCAVASVGSAVVGGAVGVSSLAVKGTVGATKLAYRGTKAVVKGTAGLARSRKETDLGEPYRPPVRNRVQNRAPVPDIADDYANLPDAND